MKNNSKPVLAAVSLIIVVAAVFGYLYFSQPPLTVALSGSGATFPVPLLNAMFADYRETKSNVQITYDGVGSSSGIAALESKTVDFVCSDAPLSASDRVKAPNALHIPETIGAVAVAYNIDGESIGLHLSGDVLADIFAGKITKWDDPEIKTMNPDLSLPNQEITVVHRSDGSGTTFIFTSYLSEASSSWADSIGHGKTVDWPVGLGASGNLGVASVLQANPYTIGYLELAYIIQNDITVAALQNPSGNYVTPSLESSQIAAQSGASAGLPAGDEDWSNVDLLNAQDPDAYPIVSFTYTLVYKELNMVPSMTQDKATALVDFLWWMIHDGQQNAPELEYVQLPNNVIQVNEAAVRSITFYGEAVLK